MKKYLVIGLILLVVISVAFVVLFGSVSESRAAAGKCKVYKNVLGMKAAEICYYPNILYSATAHKVRCGGAGSVTLNTYLSGFYWQNAGAKCVDYTWDSVDVGSGWADLWFKAANLNYKTWQPSISCLRYGSDGHTTCN